MKQSTQIIDLINRQDYALLNLNVNEYSLFNIAWNLFLILLPFLIFKLIHRIWTSKERKSFSLNFFLASLFLLWVLFIPNTAYVITDVRHLLDFCPLADNRICFEGAWMPLFFYIYATIGWISFVLLVKQMKDFIADIFGKKIAKIFIITIIPLISLGVLLGLLERWNSWDLFYSPYLIFKSALNYFSNFHYFIILLIYTLSFYVLYFIGDKLFKKNNT